MLQQTDVSCILKAVGALCMMRTGGIDRK